MHFPVATSRSREEEEDGKRERDCPKNVLNAAVPMQLLLDECKPNKQASGSRKGAHTAYA